MADISKITLPNGSSYDFKDSVARNGLAGKAASSHTHSDYALKSKYGDTTIDVGRKSGTTVGRYSTAEGVSTTASGYSSHAEGTSTTASGVYSHAEGLNTTASGSHSHAEGGNTTASGSHSHAEGTGTTASGDYSHAEGSVTIASGLSSHAEGTGTTASGDYSHAGGLSTQAQNTCEVAYGRYNISSSDTLFSVGDGTADDARHNAFEITTTGGKLHDKDIATTNQIVNNNLLINPDFKINQRGNTSYTSLWTDRYTVDRWIIAGTCTPTSTGVTVSANESGYSYGVFVQILENYISGQTVTVSTKVNGSIYQFSGNTSESYIGGNVIKDSNSNDVGYIRMANDSDTKRNNVEFIIYKGYQMEIEWVKLEYGSVATPFVPPDPATELLKCQRYYQVRSGNNISAVDLRPNMRDGVVPTITALADGNYSYEAEL